mmetsp:Transcript_34713/g.68078  ORF Transcript_34713/g.68078 Transcript_34713/m.68078 type:complete len:222 (-) Transcript_34713:433-1098(-)
MDACWLIELAHWTTMSHLRRSATEKVSLRGSSSSVLLIGSILLLISQNSFKCTIGKYLPVSGHISMWSSIGPGMPLRGNTLCSATSCTASSGFQSGTISSSCSSVTLRTAFCARMALSFSEMSPLRRFLVRLALGRLVWWMRLMTSCCTSSLPMSNCGCAKPLVRVKYTCMYTLWLVHATGSSWRVKLRSKVRSCPSRMSNTIPCSCQMSPRLPLISMAWG